MKRLKKLSATVLILSAATACAALLAEGLFRALEYRPTPEIAWFLDTDARDLDAESLCINPAFRKPDYCRAQPGAYHIITLGDSFTEGYPVFAHHAFPAVLERLLSAAGAAVTVTNYGMGNSGPDQHLRLFEGPLLSAAPLDALIWVFTVSDVKDNLNYSLFAIDAAGRLEPSPAHRNWLWLRQRFYERTPFRRLLASHSRVYALALKSFEQLPTIQAKAAARDDPAAWSLAKIRLGIERMQQTAADRGFALYLGLTEPQLLHLPLKTEYESRAPGPYNELWCYYELHELLSAQPNFVDFAINDADLTTLAVATGLRFAPTAVGEQLFAGGDRDGNTYGDRHFNEFGYWLMGYKAARALLSDSDSGSIRHPARPRAARQQAFAPQ